MAINVGLATSMGVAPLAGSMLIVKTGWLEAPAFLLAFGAALVFLLRLG